MSAQSSGLEKTSLELNSTASNTILLIGSNKLLLDTLQGAAELIRDEVNISFIQCELDELEDRVKSCGPIALGIILKDLPIHDLKKVLDQVQNNDQNCHTRFSLVSYFPSLKRKIQTYGQYIKNFINPSNCNKESLSYFLYQELSLTEDIKNVVFKNEYDTSQEEIIEEFQNLTQTLEKFIIKQTNHLLDENESLISLVTQKKNLVRNLYHDLNNALTIILGTASLAETLDYETKENAEKLTKLWNKVLKASKIQKSILNQIKELDSAQSGKVSVQLSKVKLKRVFDNALFIFKDKLDEKNISLNIHLPDPELTVQAEEVSLSNFVINNLISNSIKFSFDKSEINVNVVRQDDSTQIIIQDFGTGIPKNILSDIFSTDKKTTTTGTKGEKGTGFGMPLVHYYLNSYESTIAIESKYIDDYPNDHGTVYKITFKN